MVKIPRFHCRGFSPWSGKFCMLCGAAKKKFFFKYKLFKILSYLTCSFETLTFNSIYFTIQCNKYVLNCFSYKYSEVSVSFKSIFRASLVAQWLRICLLMQGTQVRALVWEDPTCRGAAGPVSHNC